MKYFDKFTSNTYASSGNQLFFATNKDEVCTGRIFYKISVGGKYNYSLLFSNIIDSTYLDGTVSHNNLICDEWVILGARIGRCRKLNALNNITELVMDEDIEVSNFVDITFDGKTSKAVMPGEFFSSDPVILEYDKGDYLCLEISFSGKMIPYHEETLLPVFIKDENGWKYSKLMPLAGMIGCDRQVKGRIGYIGDSITQGIGTPLNSYTHWNAILSEKLGDGYSYWNMGIGCARAYDAASDGAWLYKARQNDIVFVCYGVNDIFVGRTVEEIEADLTYIADTLKKEGKKVIVQTIPTFDFYKDPILLEKWERVNSYILSELKDKVDFVFDNTVILGKKENPAASEYGPHTNEEGCRLWADALYEDLKEESWLFE